ncbi:hypothetical protein MM1S1540310_4001 [Mycobacteroides abscessus subsp. bolletii 1S-154-0310]|nr:hypothetical protein MM1S1510930_4445 [Mycobacteroides abscessus subsp. bolletii 1S-151-0930]EIU68063.1 hypothetical protein MM1S1520914_4653 [Mycobacteroides abscessus subsp. bolletii 1S-152-0914]EIU71197.1 hypothetical protein MM1S1530915_3997 [Mycobacteroides abscessus subsp. bolletii 1S-153-0915]EIU81104.1 hypothetical protein MM1S1540310_4001 [Mycobacteroides abscessus subsp. bolletii 1S-154-0310]
MSARSCGMHSGKSAGRYSWLAPDQALLSTLTGGALLVALYRL